MKKICISDTQVSLEPMPSDLSKKLSNAELKHYIALLEKAQFYPHRAFEEVKEFQSKHPDLPEAMNLLTFVTIQKKEIAKAEKMIQESYEKFPHYLFARINYADQCLRKKQLQKIPEIFSSFNLKDLYPEKRVFHYSEFRGFMVTLGFYHLTLKNRKEAKECLDHAKKADPDHSSVKLLEKKLRPNLFKRLLRLK
ncbi:MAG TPA: hypothetical protein VLG76_07690 [Rhabdochlamydiaceae bacterium]|nr:hypothetical protein [Rhabdochlamydiaceae bacterium]